jgi:hypothetical protein
MAGFLQIGTAVFYLPVPWHISSGVLTGVQIPEATVKRIADSFLKRPRIPGTGRCNAFIEEPLTKNKKIS